MSYRQKLSSITEQLELLFAIAPRQNQKSRRRVSQSDPILHEQWCQIRKSFFPELTDLDSYVVAWSNRPQKRVLASCNIHRRRILVAKELNQESVSCWLEPILYHEMCHAVIGHGVALSRSGKRQWHGAEFKALEARHPNIVALDEWIKSGGWARAVRSSRSKEAWRRRRSGDV